MQNTNPKCCITFKHNNELFLISGPEELWLPWLRDAIAELEEIEEEEEEKGEREQVKKLFDRAVSDYLCECILQTFVCAVLIHSFVNEVFP